MLKKWCLLVIIAMCSWSWTALAQLKREYQFEFPGWKEITPTHTCSVIDLVILLQGAQAKLKKGESADKVAFFEGELPPPGVTPQAGATPENVAKALHEGLTLFTSKEGITTPIPALPTGRKFYPADPFVYGSLAVDVLSKHLEEKGVKKLGDSSLLRFRYIGQLKPEDCTGRANLVLANWKAMYP